MSVNYDELIHPVQEPTTYMPSVYCNTPEMHARDLPGMVSVNLRELFPQPPRALLHEGRRRPHRDRQEDPRGP